MPQIDLNITDEYGLRWSLKHAVREVVANAHDVATRPDGRGSFKVEHSAAKQLLTVTSDGLAMGQRALIFGNSVGHDSRIGRFGDGLKVALAVFRRLGVAVKVNTGREIWTIGDGYRDGVRVVVVNTRALPAASHRERVVFEINGVSADDWATWQKDYLFLVPPQRSVKTEHGTLILDKDRQGCIFSRGVLIQRTDSKEYGYDLPDLTLNRDRECADDYEVRAGIRRVWAEASRSAGMGPDMYDLLAKHDGDIEITSSSAHLFSESAPKVVEAFRAAHGDSVPVSSSYEATLAGQNGRQAVVVPSSLLNLLQANGVRSLSAEIAARREDVAARYTDADLSARELDALQGALTVFAPAVAARAEAMPVVEVVDFSSPATIGLYVPDTDRVLIARRLLGTHALYGVLAHEVAHRKGCDGSAAHRQAIEDIMARVISSLLGGVAS